MKSFIKKLIPKRFILLYHLFLAKFAAWLYRHPSEKMMVIGITGTNGKSSTVNFTAQILEKLGKTVGYTSTAGFTIAGEEIENRMKMTMPGRFFLQKILRDMVKAGCEYAIVETSSQGVAQHRHIGINYDIAAFTNLTPEHIESHGSFEAYRAAKGRFFAHAASSREKQLDGQKVIKKSVINIDDEHADYFKNFAFSKIITTSWDGNKANFLVKKKKMQKNGLSFNVNEQKFETSLLAEFQHENLLTAIGIVSSLGFSLAEIAKIIPNIQPVPGRFQQINQGQPFHVIVDYAYEPYALQALFESVKKLKPKRIIGIHGSAGGGRDIARRPKIGKLAADMEDIVIVTNEDPYEEDPRQIIEQVALGAIDGGKILDKDLFIFDERKDAIDFAIKNAKKGDAVLLTAKGSEPVMAVAGGYIPWSDIDEAKDSLKKAGYEG